MLQYLVNFASSGDPNGNGQVSPGTGIAVPTWPAYTPSTTPTMVLDTKDRGGCTANPQYRVAHCEFWQTVPDADTPIY